MDYSSYITIDNQLSCSLTLVNYGTNSGYWEKSPPKSIGGETKSAQFQVKDYWGTSFPLAEIFRLTDKARAVRKRWLGSV
ncbi:hypothetical protein BFW01_g7367 [Lasiodiplodia theobromae]|nr:hypothetical protein BFW01_g7367 [Lasiodiplodia theobromae]